jgi:hypothetical protein
MEDKARRYLHILDDLTLYQPDRSKQMLGVMEGEDTLLFSETKQDTAALLKAWLACSVALEVSSNLFSMVAQTVTTNSSIHTRQSSTQGNIESPPQDKIIKTLIAYADNEANATLRRANKGYQNRLHKKLESISRQICTLACTWQEVALQKRWQAGDDLERSRLILLLLDDNFVNTEYCFCPRLDEVVGNHPRTAYVIPIYLRPCITEHFLFDTLPFYPSKIQGAVSQHTNKDTAFEIISQGIQEAVKDIRDRILRVVD